MHTERAKQTRGRMRQRIAASLLGALAFAVAGLAAPSVIIHLDAVPPLEPGATANLFPPLTRAPLDGPLILTGSFGEHRNSHVHAGLDFSTGGVVGKPVIAPLDGVIDRVRSSGAGYGRSIYLHAADGRLLVFGHLDAYDEPLASFVAAAQDSSGQYEQDLWPAAGRFRVKAGQRLGWSGRSGTGSPHLHFEVRRGDMALNPLRAGVAARDTQPPEVAAVTLEPIDAGSTLEGGTMPVTLRFGARSDTLELSGRARAVVQATDPGERRSSMAPWDAGVAWGAMRYEWRADSISWATDLPEVDYIYDLGRAAPFAKTTMAMWSAAGFRPRTSSTSVPIGENAGVIEVRPGDPPRPLVVFARDLVGHETSRIVWLRGPAANAHAAAPRAADSSPARPRWDLAGLPTGAVRLEYRGGAQAHHAVRLEGRDATMRDGVWSVVLERFESGVRRLHASGVDASGLAWSDTGTVWTVVRPGESAALPAVAGAPWTAASQFEPGPVAIAADADPLELPAELTPVQPAFDVLPAGTPLRTAWRFASAPLTRPAPGASARVAFYHVGREGWEWCGAIPDSRESSDHGRVAPARPLRGVRGHARAAHHAATRAASCDEPGAYSTWALVATLADEGSGVERARDALHRGRTRGAERVGRACARELRWRPLRAPEARHASVRRGRGRSRRATSAGRPEPLC